MAVFVRRESPPPKMNDYTKYRPYVRDDFRECCAYCLLCEILAGGPDNFELDHFRPKVEFPSLVNEFYNIYYSCHVCNHYKAAAWPNDQLRQLGYAFVDFCEDSFSEHFREEHDGTWKALTKPAEYTEERMRLNREHLVEIRSLLRKVAESKGMDPIDWDVPSRDATRRILGIAE